jgi:hypothetical protein
VAQRESKYLRSPAKKILKELPEVYRPLILFRLFEGDEKAPAADPFRLYDKDVLFKIIPLKSRGDIWSLLQHDQPEP